MVLPSMILQKLFSLPQRIMLIIQVRSLSL